MLAHVGQGAFSTGARCLPLLGRIYAKRLPNKLMSSDNCKRIRDDSVTLTFHGKRIRDAALYTFVYHYTFAAKSKSLII